MRRFLFAVACLGAMQAAGPLSAQTRLDAAGTAPLPSVVLPPELDRVLRDYERAWRARDAAALAALFAQDGFVLQDSRPPIRGRPAIQAAYESQSGGPLRLRALSFAAGETVGYIIGAYGYGRTPGDTGKFTLTLQRAPDGAWLIFSDMDNQDASRQAPATPGPSDGAGRQAVHEKGTEETAEPL